ncbi:hypothetical protein [Caballeronia sp. SBC1]|jgi:hypothetical protein|uniref:hypothetical protein n=1 Tax=Caballeronia sp. SBC1 TaxID=2705548 RepID=UPI001A9CED0F|nr:hypothetical protein [Caballeronia sp. SBC1]
MSVSEVSALLMLQFKKLKLVVHTDTLAQVIQQFYDGERLISGPVLGDQEVEPFYDPGR